jgi:hypothetical protein
MYHQGSVYQRSELAVTFQLDCTNKLLPAGLVRNGLHRPPLEPSTQTSCPSLKILSIESFGMMMLFIFDSRLGFSSLCGGSKMNW